MKLNQRKLFVFHISIFYLLNRVLSTREAKFQNVTVGFPNMVLLASWDWLPWRCQMRTVWDTDFLENHKRLLERRLQSRHIVLKEPSTIWFRWYKKYLSNSFFLLFFSYNHKILYTVISSGLGKLMHFEYCGRYLK